PDQHFRDDGEGNKTHQDAEPKYRVVIQESAPGGPLREDEMCRLGSGHVLNTAVTQGERIEPAEEVFAGAEENRADGDVHFINESALEILPDGADTATDTNILTLRRFSCPTQRCMDAIRDEMKGCAAFHRD